MTLITVLAEKRLNAVSVAYSRTLFRQSNPIQTDTSRLSFR